MPSIDQPRFILSRWDTPLQELKNISASLGGPRILIKRDDLTDIAMGGNKTRKLEFLLADALKAEADCLITAGGIQSNHCRLTAATAVRAGLDCHLVLAGDKPEDINGNLVLDKLFDASIHWCAKSERESTLQSVAADLRAQGRCPYVIPVGGSTGVGALGYVNAFMELQKQMQQLDLNVDRVLVASSSGGTHAGLELGARLTGFTGQVLGISIDQVKTGTENFLPILAEIANDAAKLLGVDGSFGEADFRLNCDYLGAGYAIMGEMEREAIQLMSRQEAIILGPVYTGRAFGGLIDLIRKGDIGSDETVVFWHTGGTPEVFAYKSNLVGDQP